MKKTIIILAGIMFIMMFQVPVYSLITSRVEGIVIDKDTREPLEGVKVFLHRFINGKPSDGIFSQAKTNEKGYFRMDDIIEGRFFIGCKKPGYATIYPDYLFYPSSPEPEVDAFDMNEGQVKYFKIQMERGGNLKVVVQRKDESGISGIENFNFRAQIESTIAKKDGIDMVRIDTPLTDVHGVSLLENFYPGEKLKLTFNLDGFPPVEKEVIVKKYETAVVTHIFDYTEKPGLTGKINYNSNRKLNFGRLTLFNSKYEIYGRYRIIINKSSEYQFRNIDSGDYILIAYVSYDKNDNDDDNNEDEELEKIQYHIKLERGKTVILDLNF